MKILILTDFDNGGQMISLKKAFDNYTHHEARLITFRQTYLDYEVDMFNPSPDDVKEMADWADFFILGEVLVPNVQSEAILNKINQNNCIVRAGGSLARNHPELYCTSIFAKIMKTGAYHDVTLASRIFPMAHTVNMYHFDEWPKPEKNILKPLRLVFSGTALKRTAEHSGPITEAWDMLRNNFDPSEIEFVTIKNTSWKETLKIKSTCDICYDQTLLGAYASSSIEGMFYDMPTFCYVSDWCRSIHPEVPVISVRTALEIFGRTVNIVKNHGQYSYGHDYAVQVHGAQNAIKRWTALIDYVQYEYGV